MGTDGEPCRKKARSNQESGLCLLPDELCLIIFRQLTHKQLLDVSETCVRFGQLTRDPSLWREISLDTLTLRGAAIHSFTDKIEGVESLKLRNRRMEKVAESELLQILLKFKRSLRRLELSDEVVLSSSSIERLHRLENLSTLVMPGSHVTKSSLLGLSKLKHLQEIRIPGCEKLSGDDLVLFFSKCRNLKLVDISDCGKIVTTKVVSALAQASPGLQHLVLDESESVNPACLKALSAHCPCLTHLSLEGCDNVTDTSIVNLVTRCTQIRFLSMGMCRSISCRAVRSIASNLASLEHLDLYGCCFVREKSVQAVLENCANLKYLNLRGIPLSHKFVDEKVDQYKGLEILFYAPERTRERTKRN